MHTTLAVEMISNFGKREQPKLQVRSSGAVMFPLFQKPVALLSCERRVPSRLSPFSAVSLPVCTVNSVEKAEPLSAQESHVHAALYHFS